MSSVILRSRRLVITDIRKKTTARLFTDLKVGDNFRFTVQLKNTTGASSGLYALSVRVSNLTTGDSKVFSQNEVLKYLDCFGYQEKRKMR